MVTYLHRFRHLKVGVFEKSDETLDGLHPRTIKRLQFIDFRALFLGVVSRADLTTKFGLSPTAATRDLSTYQDVHPGQIDMRDDRETASKLFNFVNLIVEIMISQPKHIDTLYEEKVSEGKKEAIKKRDGASD